MLGLGLAHDLSKRFNVFAEYDHDDYGTRNLNSLDNIAPPQSLGAGNTDRLTQHVRITANAIRVGLNLKFMDTFAPVRYASVLNPWMVYIGSFGGYYWADVGYGGNYFSTIIAAPDDAGGNQVFNNDTFQQGVSGGGQVGVQYHFQSPYYVGLVFSAAVNANKARLTESALDFVTPTAFGFSINHEFRLQNTLDIAALIGADITAQTHVYVKVGGASTHFTDTLSITQSSTFPFPIPFLQKTERKTLWGWVLGLGLAHDLSKWFNVFAEYDHDNYGTRNLNSLDNIAPPQALGAGNTDRLTQHVAITANTVRLGVNVTFEF